MHQPFSSNTPIKPLPLSVSKASSASMPNTSQFRHTTLWNNVCANLNKKLIESALADSVSSNDASVTAMHDSTQSNSNSNNTSFFYSSNHSRTSHSNFKLRKQHSRFVAASVVSGMLNIKENFTLSNASGNGSATTPSHSYPSTFSALNLTKTPNKSRANIQITTTTTVQENFINNGLNGNSPNIYFTGSQCVDIVFAYLSGNEHNHTFESGPVTREKATKVTIFSNLIDLGADL